MLPSYHATMTGHTADELRIGGWRRTATMTARRTYVRAFGLAVGLVALYLAGGAPKVRYR